MKNDEVMLQYMLICLTCRFEFDQPALQGYRGSIGKKKRLFWKSKFHYRVHKRPQLNLFLNWMDRLHFISSHTISLWCFPILPSDPRFDFPGWLFPSCFFSLMISHFSYACYICRPSHRRSYHPNTITEYCSLWNRFHRVPIRFLSSLISSCTTVLHSHIEIFGGVTKTDSSYYWAVVALGWTMV